MSNQMSEVVFKLGAKVAIKGDRESLTVIPLFVQKHTLDNLGDEFMVQLYINNHVYTETGLYVGAFSNWEIEAAL